MGAAYAFFPLVLGGKTPAIDEWEKTLPGVYFPVGNHGIALDNDDLVIDADPRNYRLNTNPLQELLDTHLKGVVTRTVKTPRGGYHFYFKKPPDFPVRKDQPRYVGIDFLSIGHYVCGAGTRTVAGPNTADGVYTVVVDAPVAIVPVELLNALERKSERIQTGSDVTLMHESKFIEECLTAAVAIQGSNGDKCTYEFACRGRDLGLPETVTYGHMANFWNPRCLPPWSESDLWEKVKHAYKYARNAVGAATPESVFSPDMASPTPFLHQQAAAKNIVSMQEYKDDRANQIVPIGYQLTDKNKTRNTLANIAKMLQADPAWRGKFKYNEFSCGIEFNGRPPWRAAQNNLGCELEKRDIAHLQVWFSTNYELEVSLQNLDSGLEVAAEPYHPVKAYLDGLQWDGIPRLDRILIDTAGCIDTAYHREIGKNLIIASVARIYEPGCQHDHVPVLEGSQGTYKSTWIRKLGGEFYSANELVRGDKDTFQNLRGRWFVELPEINATFSKADFNWLKGIISNPTDVYRRSYGTKARGVPRESVFVASINPNVGREYLKDDENRRYWPIITGRFNIAHLEQNRDQYFAEAVHRYRAREPWWITDPRIAAEARLEQRARQEKDPWADVLKDWVIARGAGFTLLDAYNALGISTGALNGYQQQRLRGTLRALNCEYEAGEAGNGVWIRKLKWEDVC